MPSHEKEVEIPVVPVNKEKIKQIWKVAGILAVVTLIEYLIAFTILPGTEVTKYSRNFLFIALTIVKAYFIMSEFMHLGHEKKSLQRAIIFPMVFMCWFILSQLMESSAVFEALKSLWGY